jgi:NACHT domain
MEGTRTIVLDSLVAWAVEPAFQDNLPDGSDVTSMYWLYGSPGLGKTSVANSLCDRLRKNGILGGSFFCKHDNVDLREPKRVLPTLIAKLVRMWGPFRNLVAKILLDEPQINPDSTRGELLLKSLRLLKEHPPHPLVLVIDALDECGQYDTRRPLLNCLVEACSLVCWLRVIITSRPEHDIKTFFDLHYVTRQDLAADPSCHDDIRLFTQRRMAAVANRRHLPYDWPQEECITKIVKRSDGLFIFVETLSRLVDVPEPDQLLAQVLSGSSQVADNTLHQLYSTAITSRITHPTPAFHSILRAIVAISANRPLSEESLAELMSIELRVVRSWVDELSSLLYRGHSKKGGVRVRHLSILEFLVGPGCPAAFRVDMGLANAELACYCLKTMANKLRFNICELKTSYLSNAEIQDLGDQVEQSIPDSLQYSCVHWSDHLCYDAGPVSVENTELLDNFFAGPQPLYWIEVLSLMHKVPVAIATLRAIKVCAMVRLYSLSELIQTDKHFRGLKTGTNV